MKIAKFWLLIAFIFVSYQVSACKLSVHTIEYPPLSMKDSKGKWQGISIDYINALLGAVDCEYELVEVPLARALMLMQNGELDMAVNITPNISRAKYLHFIGPQRKETIKLVSKKGTLPTVKTWSEFGQLGATLIWQTGADYGNKVKSAIEENKLLKEQLLYTTRNDVMFDLVLKERAHGFFVESSFFDYMQQHHSQYQLLETHPLVINAAPVFYAFSKKTISVELKQKLILAYQQLVTDGTFEKLQ